MTISAQPLSLQPWPRLADEAARLVRRHVSGDADLDDVVQEVLVRVWRHADALRDGERFGAWLSRIADNAANDHLRARQRQRLRSMRLFEEPDAKETSDSIAREDDAKACVASSLRPFVEALAPRYREVIELSELEELPHAVIATRLGLSVSGVKSRVQRGREQLRLMLERCCEIALDARGAPVSCELRPDGLIPAGCCAGGAAPEVRALSRSSIGPG
jgi:RNA polymerase sigma-70 factor (ECF subfamily)